MENNTQYYLTLTSVVFECIVLNFKLLLFTDLTLTSVVFELDFQKCIQNTLK